MVRVIYDIGEEKLDEQVIEPNVLLTNKKGGYFLDYPNTKYRGMYTCEPSSNGWTLIKSIDSLSISGVSNTIKTNLWSYKKKYHRSSENFFYHEDSLLYEVENYKGISILTLDLRDIYDFDTEDRNYKLFEENGFLIIQFKKGMNFIRYLAIKSNVSYEFLENWVEKSFSFDKKRNNAPYNWYVFEALKFIINGDCKIAISFSNDKTKAMNNANYFYYSHKHIKSQKELAVKSIFSKKSMNKKLRIAYGASLKSLDDLIVDIDGFVGIYAGLPWFFQVWTRDEAVSLGALIDEKKYNLVKKILFRLTANILPDGRISNRMPASSLGSADGVGWVFKRFSDIYYKLKSEKRLNLFFENHEISEMTQRLKNSLDKTLRYYTKHELVINRKKETWMDTDVGNDPRDGARIEIQALTLNMLKLVKDLCRHIDDPDYKKYSKIEKNIKKKVKKVFFNRDILYDGVGDPTIRPNIFIAYYVYPKLLRKSEWKKVFKKAVSSLLLKWGGISTIDKKHPLFCEEYTGMDDKSYHRGDSWYWINNLTAISFNRLDKIFFSKYIKKIINASTEEILRKGVLASHCEVSSAKKQMSEGSISQAWSLAMYIELINELFE